MTKHKVSIKEIPAVDMADGDCDITTDHAGCKRCSLPDISMTVTSQEHDAIMFKRNGVKMPLDGTPAYKEILLVGELNGVRAYVQGSSVEIVDGEAKLVPARVILSTEDIYP